MKVNVMAHHILWDRSDPYFYTGLPDDAEVEIDKKPHSVPGEEQLIIEKGDVIDALERKFNCGVEVIEWWEVS